MPKILIINKCEDCPHNIFDDNEVVERYGKYWCLALDVETPDAETNIHPDCPIPDSE